VHDIATRHDQREHHLFSSNCHWKKVHEKNTKAKPKSRLANKETEDRVQRSERRLKGKDKIFNATYKSPSNN
jgi:hypothetical protein